MWVQTFTGRRVDLLEPDPASIDLENDVALALSRIVRFNGHTTFPYSVAEHCAQGAGWLLRSGLPDAESLALRFLLHDAHEAYIGDIATPVGEIVCDRTWLRLVRFRLDRAIWKAATGLDWLGGAEIGESVREFDLRMLRAERDQICAKPPASWGIAVETAEPLPVTLAGDAHLARKMWLELFRALAPSEASRV